MGKAQAKTSRHRDRRRNADGESDFSALIDDLPAPSNKTAPPLVPKTTAQADYLGSILRNQVTFGTGPAGVGKTYVAARIAAQLYEDRAISKILLTRPAVESGRSIGYLPGELEEKMAPYMASYAPGFRDGFGSGKFDYLKKAGKIEIVPLNFMQGLSWDENVIVLFDEAENATPAEMKMFLTRIGERAKVVIDGDPSQKMITGQSGLIDSMKRLRYVDSVSVVQFTRDDIVRSGIVRAILDAYDDDAPEQKAPEHDEQWLPGFITNGNSRR